jgi:hypothetical protein
MTAFIHRFRCFAIHGCSSCSYGLIAFAVIVQLISAGCNFLPDVRHQTQFHNPFPQLKTVAVLPFRNQSESATLSGERVSQAYAHEMQSVPGFEVLPIGATRNQLRAFEQQLGHPVMVPEDFQRFAQFLGVDAIIQGAITDYEPYYPPRLTLKTNWYTANPNFHPIPVGYGLPWGTKSEKDITEAIRLESERELASEQLSLQTPIDTIDPTLAQLDSEVVGTSVAIPARRASEGKPTSPIRPANAGDFLSSTDDTIQHAIFNPNPIALDSELQPMASPIAQEFVPPQELQPSMALEPAQQRWPDPEGFIPPSPSTTPPIPEKFTGPIMSHMATYNGANEDFTNELEEYFYFRDDARNGGWEAYLQRSEDFIRFCCYLHVKQTLVSRGGQLKNRTIVRWPISRYQR